MQDRSGKPLSEMTAKMVILLRMGIIERHVSEYEGHRIELVRNALVKTLTLRIDDRRVARASCAFPRDIILTGALEHQGVQHSVRAHSLVRLRLLSREESIAVDGVVIPGATTP